MLEHKEQVDFFERLKDTLPVNYNLVAEIAEILGLSADSAYRRMRGGTALSYSELLKIQQRMNLKQSILFPQDRIEEVNFEYARPAFGYDTLLFLKEIEKHMHLANRRSHMEITLASDDLPFFMHFLSPGLLQFKLLVFSGRNIHNVNAPQEYDPELQAVCESILKKWLEADAMEIWGSNPLDSTLKQISFYMENEMIGPDYAHYLLKELVKMSDLVNTWAATGKKSHTGYKGGNIALYQSELNMGEMTLILSFGEEMTTYKSNYGYGYLRTEHPKFCEETMTWMKDLASKGILISGSGEKYRNRYVQLLKSSIKDTAKSFGMTV